MMKLVLAALLALPGSLAFAHEYEAGDLMIASGSIKLTSRQSSCAASIMVHDPSRSFEKIMSVDVSLRMANPPVLRTTA